MLIALIIVQTLDNTTAWRPNSRLLHQLFKYALCMLAAGGLLSTHLLIGNTLAGNSDAASNNWQPALVLAVITLFNPHVYLDTVLLVGSIGARQEGDLKWVFVAGAASASALWFAGLSAAGRRLKHWFAQPLAWRILDGLTGAMMLSLAWWVWQGLVA